MHPDDEMMNNVLVAGAITACLWDKASDVKVVTTDQGEATNELVVRFPFVKSEYKITVERLPGTERSALPPLP